MPAKRSLTLALALLLVAAIPAQASGFPTLTIADDIQPGTVSSTALWNAGRLGDYLYTTADDGVTGYELWRTNGVTSTQVANINTNSSDGSYPDGFTALGDWLYFSAADATHGQELWRTNGTSTTRVADINTAGTDGSYPYGLTALGGYVYFNATVGATWKLWRVSAAGTVEPSSPAGTNVFFGCMCAHPILTLNGRLFALMSTDETGMEFVYLDEPTYGLPLTNRDSSAWSTALVLLAALTAAAAVALRTREVKRA